MANDLSIPTLVAYLRGFLTTCVRDKRIPTEVQSLLASEKRAIFRPLPIRVGCLKRRYNINVASPMSKAFAYGFEFLKRFSI